MNPQAPPVSEPAQSGACPPAARPAADQVSEPATPFEDVGREPGSLPADATLQAFLERRTPSGMTPRASLLFWPSAWRTLQMEEQSE